MLDFSPEKIKKIFENPIYRGQASKYLRKWGWVEIPTPFFLLPGSVAKNGPLLTNGRPDLHKGRQICRR